MSESTTKLRRSFTLILLFLLATLVLFFYFTSSNISQENERFDLRPIIAYVSFVQNTTSSLAQNFCNDLEEKGSNKYFIQSWICKSDFARCRDVFHKIRRGYVKVIEGLIQLRKKRTSTQKHSKDDIDGYLSGQSSTSSSQQNGFNDKYTNREGLELHSYPSIIPTLQSKDVGQKRIAIGCDPNKEVLSNKDNDKRGMDDYGNDPYSGMVLQIFPQNFDLKSIYENIMDEQNQNDGTSIELRHDKITSRRSSSDVDVQGVHQPCKELTTVYQNTVGSSNALENSNNALSVNEYVLLEVMQRSLGRIDFHNQDYAYRPVTKFLGSGSSGTNQKNKNSWIWDDHGSESDYERMGNRAFAGGSHGEVWKARRKCNQMEPFEGKNQNQQMYQEYQTTERRAPSPSQYKQSQYQHKQYFQEAPTCDDKKDLILKRIKVGENVALYEAGLREIYFGDILNRSDDSQDLFTIYIDHFFLNNSFMSTRTELWIVFENAGPSLRSYIYSPVTSGDFILYQHSPLWRRLRMEFASRTESTKTSSSVAVVSDLGSSTRGITFVKPDGSQSTIHMGKANWNMDGTTQHHSIKGEVGWLMKDILIQIIKSAAKLHERGIIHRDIKPSNIMCRARNKFDDVSHGINCVLGDFSSMLDDFSSENFYSNGPSAAEQTNEYAPPEVLFGEEWIPFDKAKPETYDSWSIGVVILELLLGTPNVFSVDQRTTTLLTNKMTKEGASEEDIERALYLAALSQFCIYVPTNESDKSWPLRKGDPLFKASIVKTTCTIHDFHSALRARDPLGLGFDNSIDPLLQLIWGLLAWNPKDRLTPSEALEHFYFTNEPYQEDGEYHALEPQMLDPRLDTDIEKRKIESFICPKCGRKFDDLQSCQAHATGRRHSKFCSYDRSLLPPCLNAHSMLPSHPTSGYCDIQGRRRVIEDFHTVHLEKDHQFFGVFDGHNGNLASKYAASELYKEFVKHLGDIDDDVKNGTDWKKEVEDEMNQSFEQLHRGVLDAIKSYPTGAVMSKSGTTATALFVTEYAVIVASVGDSRAVLSVGTSFDSRNQASSIQLTFDHVASDKDERKRIESLGGTLSSRGGVLRVNGTLVLSRSIGDAHLEEFLSRQPNVVTMTKQEVNDRCKLSKTINDDNEMPCFIILASDGLWDVFTNQEAVDLVEQVIQKYDPKKGEGWETNGGAFQEAAEVLTQEAYVRGSTDNIGVCVVAIT